MVGAPDAGKTALAVQLADEFAERGVPVGFLGVDEEPGDLLMRLAQRRGFSREQCERRDPMVLGQIRNRMESLSVRFYSAGQSIEKAARDLYDVSRNMGKPSVLFIDSIQTAFSDGERDASGTSRYEVVTTRIGAVRAVAEQYGMLVIATSEMGRSFYRNAAAAADLDDLAGGKESGAIEYSGRVLLSLRAVPGEPGIVELKIPKNKHGPRTPPDQRGLFIRLDRASQRLAVVEDYSPPSSGAQMVERKREQYLKNAAHVAVVLARNPGIIKRVLRADVRVRAGGMSNDGIDAALSVLGDAVVKRLGKQRREHHHLDGTRVPTEVTDLIAEKDRQIVKGANVRDMD